LNFKNQVLPHHSLPSHQTTNFAARSSFYFHYSTVNSRTLHTS